MVVGDELAEKALAVLAERAGGCPSLDPHSELCDDTDCACRTVIHAALEAIAPALIEQGRREGLNAAMNAVRAVLDKIKSAPPC